MTKNDIDYLECFRCGYKWKQKGHTKPSVCASCNSPYWNTKSISDSPKRRLLKSLRMSRHVKEKSGWSRDLGAGFISEDVKSVEVHKSSFTIEFCWPHSQTFTAKDLNLRETDELIKWIENNL